MSELTPEEVEEMSEETLRDRLGLPDPSERVEETLDERATDMWSGSRSQEVGGEVLDGIAETGSVPEEDIIETSGLLSYVEDSEGETLGHILMTEWDDTDRIHSVISDCLRRSGISVLLRSSPGNYHLYNLSVRGFEEHLRDATAGTGDLGHARWAARRGYFVLRALPKYRAVSRDVYKPAPEVLRVFHSEPEHPQSQPHLEMLRSMTEDPEIVEEMRLLGDRYETIGEGFEVDHYRTVSDRIKEVRSR